MAMIEGWLLDVHANHDNTGMTAWVVDDEGRAHACEVPWQPVIVHASHADQSLGALARAARNSTALPAQPAPHGAGTAGLGGHRSKADVLEIGLQSFQHFGLAEHVESRGDFHRFKLYSVDAHLAQRFLNDHECIPFGRVRWSSLMNQPDCPRAENHRRVRFTPLSHGQTFSETHLRSGAANPPGHR